MNEFLELEVSSLEFDEENPRLPTSVKGGDEDQILEYLATKTRIENLISSIGENGFFPGEAIVVVPRDDKYVVIEGNRRLAALRLLLNPSLAPRPSIARAAEEAENKPTKVRAYVVESRDDTLQYLGFRHISGVQRWDPLAKARYLEALFERVTGNAQERYTAVAREIGSNGATVRRNLDALAAYRIVEGYEFYEISEIDEETFHFGTFYTAISDSNIANFVGVRSNGRPRHPIEDATVVNEEHLEELVRWMFERDARGNTRLIESRNISKLGTVVKDPESLKALRSNQTLEAAYLLTPHGRDDFMRHINEAIQELKQANANLHAVPRDDRDAKDRVEEVSRVLLVTSEWLE